MSTKLNAPRGCGVTYKGVVGGLVLLTGAAVLQMQMQMQEAGAVYSLNRRWE